jgi:copper transport protein
VGRRPAALAAPALAIALLAPAVGAPTAAAHADLEKSAPADGVTLGGAPRKIQLRFSEAISPRFRVVHLIDGRGRVVAGTSLRSGSDPSRLVLDIPSLRRGAYEVAWEVVAQGDGHVTGGAIVFGVRARPQAGGRTGPAPGTTVAPLSAWTRWLDLVLLCALVGALLMAGLLSRLRSQQRTTDAIAERPQRVLLRAAAAAGMAAALLGLVLLARQLHQLRATVAPGAGLGDLLGARWGVLWLLREALLVDLAVLALALRRRASGAAAAVAAALLVGVVAVHAMGSHAAAGPHRGAAVAVAAAHVLAAGVWIGGVSAFALALAVAGRHRLQLGRDCAMAFGRVAGAALVVLVLTGLLAAGSQVASIDALLETDYGRTLLIKTGLFEVAAALGLGNAILLRRGEWPRLMRVEAGAGLAVLLAAAVLAASPPAKGPEFAPPRAIAAPTVVREAGDLVVSATVRPNRPGANVVTVLTASSRRPPPGAVRGVSVRLQPRAGGPAVTADLAPVGGGRFAGGTELAAEGPWRATVFVERGGKRTGVSFGWSVDRADPARPVVHSARRLAPLLDRAALALALALAVFAVARSLLRRRRARRPEEVQAQGARATLAAALPGRPMRDPR